MYLAYWLISCLALFALGMKSTDRLIQIWNCREKKKSSYWAAIEMPRLGEGKSLNYNLKSIVAMFTDIPFCWPAAQELLVFLGPRGYLTHGTTVPLVWASWTFSCLSWLYRHSGRLGFSVLCFAVLAVVCRARGEDTDCSRRAVLEAVYKTSSVKSVWRALHPWLWLVSCSQSGLSNVFHELKCIAVEKYEGQLVGLYFLQFYPLFARPWF